MAGQLSTILEYILQLLEEITAEWDPEPISAATELGSLGIESINLVYLLAEVQQEYSLGDRLLGRLRTQQIDVRVVCVGELVELVAQIAHAPREARP
jgi:hypothetical protein